MSILEILTQKPSKLHKAWRFDKDGYLISETRVQENPMAGNALMLPDDCTTIDPEVKDGFFSRFVDGAWTYEKIPTTPEDMLGLVIPHKNQTKHEAEMMLLVQKLTEGSSLYRVKRGPELEWEVEAIPQPTEEEKALDAAKQSIRSLQYKLDSTDWVCVKIIDARYREGTEAEAELAQKYSDVIAERESYREQINAIESQYGLDAQNL